MSQTSRKNASFIVIFEQMITEGPTGLVKVFDALDMKLDNPSVQSVHKFLRSAGVDERTSKKISAGYIAYKEGKGSKEKIAAMLMESLDEKFRPGQPSHFNSLLDKWAKKNNVKFKWDIQRKGNSKESTSSFRLDLNYDGYMNLSDDARLELNTLMRQFGVDFKYSGSNWTSTIAEVVSDDCEEDEVDEITTNANVQGYNSPGAFSRDDEDAKKRQANLTKIAHGTLAKSINEAKDEKTKVAALLIKYGNNPNDVKKMVDKHWKYVSSVYPDSPVSKKAEIIRTIYESINEGVSFKQLSTNPSNTTAHGGMQHFSKINGKDYVWNYVEVKDGKYVVVKGPTDTIAVSTMAGKKLKAAKLVKESINEGKFYLTYKDSVWAGHRGRYGFFSPKALKKSEYELFDSEADAEKVISNIIKQSGPKVDRRRDRSNFNIVKMNESKGCGCGCGCDGKKKLNENIYGEDGYEKWAEEIKKGIKAPYVNVYVSTLGGKERASIMFTVGMDSKDNWPNNILENSRYGKFHLGYDGVLEMHSARYGKVSKFRKTRVKSVKDVITKIDKWMKESNSINEATDSNDYMGKALSSSVIKKVKEATHWNDHNEARVLLSKEVAKALKDSTLNQKGIAALVKEYERIQKAHEGLKYMSPPLLNRRLEMDSILYGLLNHIPNGKDAKKAL